MKKLTALGFLFLCSALSAAPGSLCLWKVSGAQNTVYLLGSIHILKKEFYPLPQPMETALGQAQTVVFETDLKEMEAAQLKMLMAGVCPPDKSLRDLVSAETYAALKKHLGDQTVIVDRFKPWMAAVFLVADQMQKLGFDSQQGVDQYLHRNAVKAGKKTAGLETVQFQLDLFTQLSEKDQEEVLKEALEETGQLKTMFETIIKAWQTGDIQELEKQFVIPMKKYPMVSKKFLTDRNRAWIPKILEYLKGEENVLVVVGAAHLIGDESVVALLRKEGFKVEQQVRAKE